MIDESLPPKDQVLIQFHLFTVNDKSVNKTKRSEALQI